MFLSKKDLLRLFVFFFCVLSNFVYVMSMIETTPEAPPGQARSEAQTMVSVAPIDKKDTILLRDEAKGFEIFLSPLARQEDVMPVLTGLREYNDASRGKSKDLTLKTSLSTNVSCMLGLSLVLLQNIDKIFVELGSQNKLESFMEMLEKSAFKQGAKKVLVGCNGENRVLIKILLDAGYNLLEIADSLENDEKTHYFIKTLQFVDTEENKAAASHSDAITIAWEEEKDDVSEIEGYGIFVRDIATTKILGGLIGSIKNDSKTKIPYSEISILWLNDTVRKFGLGTILMKFAEKYVKEQGINVIQVDTCSDQAPGFYKKLEYTQVFVLSEIFQSHNGSWISSHYFRKNI